jgi:proteic killer suppression protein
MIASFGDKATEDLFHGRRSKRALRFPNEIINTVLKKLDVLNAAASMQDLRSPPGNRLEALRGDLQDYFSIRVNDQWRLVFQWSGSDAENVRLTDYH